MCFFAVTGGTIAMLVFYHEETACTEITVGLPQ